MDVASARSGVSTTSVLPTPTVEQTLGVNDFLSLIAAQLQNQDMMNPMSDTDFIAQMAQFTSLQVQQATAQITSTQFAVSLMGKEALAVSLNSKTGEMERTTGVIEGVSLFEGAPIVYIDGVGFDVGQIMTLGNVPLEDAKPEEPETPDKPETPEQLPEEEK